MSDETRTWEQWETDRAGHLGRFKATVYGEGFAKLTGMLWLVGLGGSLAGCAVTFGLLDGGGGQRNLGATVLLWLGSWVPLLGWLGFWVLIMWISDKIVEKRQLGILLNDPSPSKRCNAVYQLSVIGAKGAIPHLESLLNDDTLEPQLREYTEKSLAKLKEESKDSKT